MFKIKSLTGNKSLIKYSPILFLNTLGENCLSSTVTKLTINVNTLNDCVYLLNQCFESLSTLIIHIYSIEHLSLTLNNVSINMIIKINNIFLFFLEKSFKFKMLFVILKYLYI